MGYGDGEGNLHAVGFHNLDDTSWDAFSEGVIA